MEMPVFLSVLSLSWAKDLSLWPEILDILHSYAVGSWPPLLMWFFYVHKVPKTRDSPMKKCPGSLIRASASCMIITRFSETQDNVSHLPVCEELKSFVFRPGKVFHVLCSYNFHF